MEESGTISLYLNRLENVTVDNAGGKKCVIIPIAENGIFISERGSVCANFFMNKVFTPTSFGSTHVLRRKLSKEEFYRLSKDDKKRIKEVGYFRPFVKQDNSGSNSESSYSSSQSHDYGSLEDMPI